MSAPAGQAGRGSDPSGLGALSAAAAMHPLRTSADRFVFLRHGRTAGNVRRVYQHPDEPLCPEGFADADRAARTLAPVAGSGFARIVASDMARAWLTAGRVAAAAGMPAAPAPDLRERFFGDLVGTSSVGLDWRIDPPSGETLEEFVRRVHRGMGEVLADGAPTLVVSHGGVLHVVAGMLGVALDPSWTANALPLSFRRAGTRWAAAPLPTPAGGPPTSAAADP